MSNYRINPTLFNLNINSLQYKTIKYIIYEDMVVKIFVSENYNPLEVEHFIENNITYGLEHEIITE